MGLRFVCQVGGGVHGMGPAVQTASHHVRPLPGGHRGPPTCHLPPVRRHRGLVILRSATVQGKHKLYYFFVESSITTVK